MAATDAWEMILVVADRFKFSPNEIESLRISRLHQWYEGALRLIELDRKAWAGG